MKVVIGVLELLLDQKKVSNFKLPNRELTSLNKAYIYLFALPELTNFVVFRYLVSAYEFLYPNKVEIRLSSGRKQANAAFKTANSDKANTGVVVNS